MTEKTKPVTVAYRLDPALVARMKAYAAKLTETDPLQRTVTVSDVVRVLLTRGLDEAGIDAPTKAPDKRRSKARK